MSLFTSRLTSRRAGLPGTGLRRRNGQVAIFAALTLTLMFGALGLATDLGWDYFLKQRVQTAADAAASAAVVYALGHNDSCSTVTCGTALNCSGITAPPNSSLKAGCLYATVDGPPVVTASMIENDSAHPPSGLTGVTPTMWVKATVSASSPNAFLFMWGFQTATISASAIGGITSTPAGNCIYALSSSGVSITDSGSGNITANCGIYDNGGFSYSGSGNISASQILVNGNFSDSGSGNISATSMIQVGGTYSKTGSGSVSPAHTTGTSTIANPFQGLTAPAAATCPNSNVTSYSDSSPHTLSQGTYCGGLSISGSGNITFNSGTYIINGGSGGHSFSYSGSGNLSGTGVTFIITGQNGYTAEPISISGSGNLTFSAQSSGSYEGLLFFQDPNVSYAGTNTYSGSGNVTGTFYFPTTSLSYSGSGNALAQALVANTITFTGSGNFTKDLTGTLTGLSKPTASLVQ